MSIVVRVHTVVENTLEFLANSKELNTSPHIRTYALREAECPTSTKNVASILPDRAEA
jgi:hypothetical protein